MNTTTKHNLQDAKDNAEKYIEQMKTMSDKKLSKHIELFRLQMEKAYKDKNFEAYELIFEYEKQTIEAGVSKNCK